MCRNSGGCQWSVSASILVVLILGIDSMAHGQYIGSCGMLSSRSPQGVGPPAGTGSFTVVPSVCVSERYDTNVFYRPRTSGVDLADFVTTVNPMLRVNHNGDYASGYLNIGGFSETYAKNSNLNYLGTNDSLSLNLDNSIKRFFPNAGLRVADNFSYTPLPPGFVNPAAGTSPSDPGNIQNIYVQGFLGFRTNNLMNSGTVSTSYATTTTTSLTASYTYAILRFGTSPSTQGLTLFNMSSQTGTVGGTAQLSELDTMNIIYAHTQTERTPSVQSANTRSAFFTIDSATIGWSRVLTPNLSAQLGGGGILISSGKTTFAANAVLIMNSVNNRATISYAHTAFPNIAAAVGTTTGVGSAGVLIADVFSLSAIQTIDRQWQLSEIASYTHTSGGGGLNPLTYNSYAAGGEIQYWMTSIWSTALNYSYTKFLNESVLGKTEIDRQVIALSVRATWE